MGGQASEQVAQGSDGIINPGCAEGVWIWHLGLWLTAKCDGAELTAGLGGLRGHF